MGLEDKLAEARAYLAADAALGEGALTNVPAGVPLHEVGTRRALYHRLAWLLEQQVSNAAELEATKARHAALLREAQNWTKFEEPPPYSILLSDRLREEIQEEQLKVSSNEQAVRSIDQLIGENRAMLNNAEEKIRQLNEQLEAAAEPANFARDSWQRELERVRSKVAVVSVGVLDLERRLREEAVAQSRIQLDLLHRQLVMASASTKFTQSDLTEILARIESDRQQLEGELAQAEPKATNALRALEAAREGLRRIQSSRDEASSATPRASEQVSVRETQLETAHVTVRMLRLILECENVERTMWESRFLVNASRNVDALRDSRRRLETFTRRLNLWKDYQQQQFDAFSSQIELQETRLRNLAADSDLRTLARESLASLRERDQMQLRVVRRLGQAQRLTQRWGEELHSAEGKLPFFARVQNVFSDARSFAQRLWNLELFSAEDTVLVEGQKITGRRSVTCGKIIMAVLILGVGLATTRVVLRLLQTTIIRRLKIEANQANLIFRWLRAFIVGCLVVLSLVSVKIPLTVFAFAGGALAIGLGFGMQTLLKNFVSGLILLFERPFRVGDILEAGGQRGTVTEIGLRSSVLQLWDGTETLIPNSSFLENNVSNWTYSNRKVRFSVIVGAAYGSDTRRVIQVLNEVAEKHGVVEKEPKPQVLFTNFGDSALTFELRYWVDVIRANAAQVGSDLRQMIAGAFAENGILIAFPQRDLHLDSPRPLAVQIVPTPDGTHVKNQDNAPKRPVTDGL